jgi:hypothetical protein
LRVPFLGKQCHKSYRIKNGQEEILAGFKRVTNMETWYGTMNRSFNLHIQGATLIGLCFKNV